MNEPKKPFLERTGLHLIALIFGVVLSFTGGLMWWKGVDLAYTAAEPEAIMTYLATVPQIPAGGQEPVGFLISWITKDGLYQRVYVAERSELDLIYAVLGVDIPEEWKEWK